jgi:tRNA pseudouridine55 synthase
MTVDGILNIDKPQGQTSYRVVAMVKRLSGERRVGHAGTLDPDATGVLPVCLGQGTRITEFLMDATKTYRAEIELGVATDTYDASGEVTRRGDPSGITREQVEATLSLFRGRTEQTPPMYSAVKHRGQRLYELARAGIEVARKSRPAVIHRLEIADWQPPLVTIEVECGKGTYIRSLAHDLGEALGCGAYLKSLVRLSYGPFFVRDAVTVPQLEDAFRDGYWKRFVHPVDSVLLHWRAVVVDDATEKNIRNGVPVTLEDAESGVSSACATSPFPVEARSETHCRTYTHDGHFLGVLCFDPAKDHWRPKKVFL